LIALIVPQLLNSTHLEISKVVGEIQTGLGTILELAWRQWQLLLEKVGSATAGAGPIVWIELVVHYF